MLPSFEPHDKNRALGVPKVTQLVSGETDLKTGCLAQVCVLLTIMHQFFQLKKSEE